jgi:hypothetical protein
MASVSAKSALWTSTRRVIATILHRKTQKRQAAKAYHGQQIYDFSRTVAPIDRPK